MHLSLQPLQDGLGVPVEKGHQIADQASVGLVIDRLDARTAAFLDVVQEARLAQPLMGAELVVAAGSDRERAQQRVQRLADGIGVGVRPEVQVALVLGPPAHHGPGPLVTHRHRQKRVALVVPQAHVEAGLVLLDQAVLQHDGFHVVTDLDPFDGLGLGDHLSRAGRKVGRVLEVVVEAAAQGLGLPDIDDPAIPVPELVGARSVGDASGRWSLQHPSTVPQETVVSGRGSQAGGRGRRLARSPGPSGRSAAGTRRGTAER